MKTILDNIENMIGCLVEFIFGSYPFIFLTAFGIISSIILYNMLKYLLINN